MIKTRIQNIKRLIESVKDHLEDDGSKYRVIYPEGYFPDGAQCSQRIGKAVALEKLLEIMERHWKESLLC